jgi:hypothetical protein
MLRPRVLTLPSWQFVFGAATGAAELGQRYAAAAAGGADRAQGLVVQLSNGSFSSIADWNMKLWK